MSSKELNQLFSQLFLFCIVAYLRYVVWTPFFFLDFGFRCRIEFCLFFLTIFGYFRWLIMAAVWTEKKPHVGTSMKEKLSWPGPMNQSHTGPDTTIMAPWNTNRTSCTTDPAWCPSSTATGSPSRPWKLGVTGPSPLWPPGNSIAIMELNGVQVSAEMCRVGVAAIFDFTTTAACLTLVAPIIMCMCQKWSGIGITNPPTSDKLTITTLYYLITY